MSRRQLARVHREGEERAGPGALEAGERSFIGATTSAQVPEHRARHVRVNAIALCIWGRGL